MEIPGKIVMPADNEGVIPVGRTEEPSADGTMPTSWTDQPLPTLSRIKTSIPSRYFESDLRLSFYFLAKDVVLVSSIYVAMLILDYLVPTRLLWVIYPIYWYVQGTLFMAIFVLGHDCGHGSFSRSGLLNDTVGTILHSFVLTPYVPWKVSHRHHHKNTGNIDKDEVFYPVRKKYHNGNNFIYLFGLGIAWFVYLAIGYHPRHVSHLNPFGAMFSRHSIGSIISLTTLVGWIGCLYYYACSMGMMGLMKHYVLPEFVFASWLVVVTFLHHVEEDTPWYADSEWTYVRGQLSSIDRQYGWAHTLVHNIGTHQIHHLFPKIPHYHLEDATKHFRKTFPDLVRRRDGSIIGSLLRMFPKFSEQFVIKDDTTIHVYK